MKRWLFAVLFASTFSHSVQADQYAVVENSTGLIVNRILLDDPAAWKPPAGFDIVRETVEGMAVGGKVIAGVYTPPQPPRSVPPPNALTPAEATRQTAIKSDAKRAALLAKLQSASNAEIDAYVAANVTNIAQAQAAIATILKLIALDARQ